MYRVAFFIPLLFTAQVAAQSWGTVQGTVTESGNGLALPGVSVLVNDTNFGTASNDSGSYTLQLPTGRYALRFSYVGFASRLDSVVVSSRSITTLNVQLVPTIFEGEELVVEDETILGAGVQQIAPEQVRRMPSPFKGFQALLVLPGVSANNELSNQYSVRGGGFNENLIFLNGFEIHMPFRPRQGEQEGLGLFNPELARRITLYTGGFPTKYGGKISSALDIEYAPSTNFTTSATLSLLDGTATAAATRGSFSWQIGLRKARARRFFSTQELKGNYQPDYQDIQTRLTYRLTPRHELEFVGLYADHEFRLDPRGRRTFYGTVSADGGSSDIRSVWLSYSSDSEEVDGYQTGLAGLRMKNRVGTRWTLQHDVSLYATQERESYVLEGNAVLYDIVTDSNADRLEIPRGLARQEDLANNTITVTTLAGRGLYHWTSSRHVIESGWHLKRFAFYDRLMEESIVLGKDLEMEPVRIVVDSLKGTTTLNTSQISLHVEDSYSVNEVTLLNAGIRTDWYEFNQEWTFSPRASLRYEASKELTLTASVGIYYQQPTYRELRGTPGADVPLAQSLNRSLRSQRSVQMTGGAELFVPQRRLYLRGEAYYKKLANLISYSLENVRINYSGLNDASGHVYGLDLQARGEFVPGMESWINYSFMVARERFLPQYTTHLNAGLRPRPTDQRHTVALFVQDYIPMDPTWKLHMRILFGSGLTYTPPIPGERIGSVVTQIPGNRHSARYPEFRRIDFGTTKIITLSNRPRPLQLEITAEMLNIFDIINTVAYSWLPDATGIWQRIPTRLTPRTINLRLRTSF
ncbi:MAG: TonB-dependent receptor [Bacteroidetes bacterium]|nr:TonB-dependent receptor [Bacteroidota bacterium]